MYSDDVDKSHKNCHEQELPKDLDIGIDNSRNDIEDSGDKSDVVQDPNDVGFDECQVISEVELKVENIEEDEMDYEEDFVSEPKVSIQYIIKVYNVIYI